MSLLDFMGHVPDPRSGRKKPHVLAEVLTYIIMGVLAGKTSVRRALKWAERHKDALREHMCLEHGIASPSTACRLLGSIDEELFLYVFMDWVGGLLDARGKHVIIDGKALRGAAEKSKGGKAPYVLNAVEAATQMVIAQLPIREKANEITEIPNLLELLDIIGATVTIDAVGSCQRIMGKVMEKGAHFVFTVKENLPRTYEQIGILFSEMDNAAAKKAADPLADTGYEEFLEKRTSYSFVEKNRSRMEYREMSACSNVSVIDYAVRHVPEIKTVGLSKQVRIPIRYDTDGADITLGKADFMSLWDSGNNGKDRPEGEVQAVGLLSDMEIGAEELARIKRAHWIIENGTHHVLDETLREDRSTAKKSRNNLALIRKFAYNLLRLAIIMEYPGNSMAEMKDTFGDDFSLMERYIFRPIRSFY